MTKLSEDDGLLQGVLLDSPEKLYELEPQLFFHLAVRMLLDSEERRAFLSSGPFDSTGSLATPAGSLLTEVASEGLLGLKPSDLLIVLTHRSVFEAVDAVLDSLEQNEAGSAEQAVSVATAEVPLVLLQPAVLSVGQDVRMFSLPPLSLEGVSVVVAVEFSPASTRARVTVMTRVDESATSLEDHSVKVIEDGSTLDASLADGVLEVSVALGAAVTVSLGVGPLVAAQRFTALPP